MTHIKYLSLMLVIGVFAFYKGMEIGSNKMGMHRVAIEWLPETSGFYSDENISTKELLKRQEDLSNGKRSEAIRTYGRYLDSISYYAPDFRELDSRTESFMKLLIEEQLKRNPDYFFDMYKYYDSVIKEEENSNTGIHEEYISYKRQLKNVEKKLIP